MFSRYDYGRLGNIKHYGTITAPEYPLKNIKGVPIALFGGLLDDTVVPIDVEWLRDNLGEPPVFYKQYELEHLGFAVGNDMSFVQIDSVDLLAKYSTFDP